MRYVKIIKINIKNKNIKNKKVIHIFLYKTIVRSCMRDILIYRES